MIHYMIHCMRLLAVRAHNLVTVKQVVILHSGWSLMVSVHTPSGVSPQSLAVVNVQSSSPSVALYMMVGETETVICERPGLTATSRSMST